MCSEGCATACKGGLNLMSVDFGLIAWQEDGRWDGALRSLNCHITLFRKFNNLIVRKIYGKG